MEMSAILYHLIYHRYARGVLDQIMLQLSDFSVGCECNMNDFFRAMRKFLDCSVPSKIGVFYWRLHQEVF